ncbi:MAG: hypothetical protein NTW06_01270 [Candidatus Falkowbacteria bacterium]|nr:hypothetical protein [Candidatus Falkowbacteria bacterium]
MEKKIKIGLLIILMVIVVIFFVNRLVQKEEPASNEKYCETDLDCVVAGDRLDTNPCCWNCGHEVINKISSDNKKLWEDENCKNISNYDCPMCKAAPSYLFMAFCDNNICKLKSAFEECGKKEDKESRDKCYKEFEIEAKKLNQY